MTDNVIQFVPKAKPNRLSLIEAEEIKAFETAAQMGWDNQIDTAPSEYTAPDGGDCA